MYLFTFKTSLTENVDSILATGPFVAYWFNFMQICLIRLYIFILTSRRHMSMDEFKWKTKNSWHTAPTCCNLWTTLSYFEWYTNTVTKICIIRSSEFRGRHYTIYYYKHESQISLKKQNNNQFWTETAFNNFVCLCVSGLARQNDRITHINASLDARFLESVRPLQKTLILYMLRRKTLLLSTKFCSHLH